MEPVNQHKNRYSNVVACKLEHRFHSHGDAWLGLVLALLFTVKFSDAGFVCGRSALDTPEVHFISLLSTPLCGNAYWISDGCRGV